MDLKHGLRFPLQSSQTVKGKGKPAGCRDTRWIWSTELTGKTAENLPSPHRAKNFGSFQRLRPLPLPSLDGPGAQCAVLCEAGSNGHSVWVSSSESSIGHARAVLLGHEDNAMSGWQAGQRELSQSWNVRCCKGWDANTPKENLCGEIRPCTDHFGLLFSPCFKVCPSVGGTPSASPSLITCTYVRKSF